ncbi:MAG: tail fiber domain-containing protein [Bacteroidetes bacterium]|nr:tail fiber domain-containing protein [Bacteroidota bacterium]
MKKNFLLRTTFLTSCMITVCLFNYAFAQSWNITGNAGITPSNYLGTKDTKALVFRTNALERGRIFGPSGAWRIGTATNSVQIDSSGVLTFNGIGAYQVGGNKYVFKYSGNPKYGLFFNSTKMQYEFRNGSATPVFYINANTGAGTFLGPVKIGAYTLPATDGTNNQVLKTDGAGNLTWKKDNNTIYTAGTGISIASGTITNTAPDQLVSLTGTKGISISGSYPNFTISGVGFWNKTGNAGTSPTTNFIGTTDSVDFVIKTKNSEVMRVTAAGDVIIGTSAPGYKLEVNGGSENGLASFGANYGIFGYSDGGTGVTGTSNHNIGVEGNGGTYGVYGVGYTYGVYGYSNGDYGVYGYSSSNYGVYGSSTKIGVYGVGNNYGVYGSSALIGTYGNGDSYGLYGYSTDGDGGTFSSANGEGSSNVSNYSYGSYHYAYENDALYAFDHDNINYYAGYFDGDVYTSGTYVSSDRNLKKNIKDFLSAMSIINQLQPKQFDFKHDSIYAKMNLPIGSHYGLIAQDVEKVLPNLVKDSKFDIPEIPKIGKEPDTTKQKHQKQSINFKAVNYTEFIPIIIKAMQEQQQMISNQQKEIDDLKTKVESLEQQKSFSSAQTASDATENNITATSATLDQNIPNPLSNSTSIGYYIPSNLHNATLMITDMNGKKIKQVSLQPGKGNITIDATTLSAGAYSYSLMINGKIIAKRKMIVTR